MKKRIIALIAVFALVLSMTAYAAESRATKFRPSLTFNGTTAECSILITSAGDEIDVTLALYRGLTRVDHWSDSGTGYVYVYGEYVATEGVTYRLVATGTINGESFTTEEILGTC